MTNEEFAYACKDLIERVSGDPDVCHGALDALIIQALEEVQPGTTEWIKKVKESCRWWATG